VEIGSKRFWHDVLAITARLAGIAESLRIPLFTGLQDRQSSGIAKEIYRFAAAIRTLMKNGRSTFPAAAPGRMLFFFAHATPSNMRNLLPVAREAHRQGRLGGIVMAGVFPEVVREFSGRVPVLRLDELALGIPLRKRCARLWEAWRVFRDIGTALEDYDPAVAGRFRRKAGTFAREIASAIQSRAGFRILLEDWRPGCVVSSSDMWPAEFQMAQEASRLGIPSAVIQHGIIGYLWWPFVASYYVLRGAQFMRDMRALGAPAERLLLGGMPTSDDLFQKAREGASGSPDGRNAPVCLILSHTHGLKLEPELAIAFRQFVIELVSAMPGVQWKVRLHPSEDPSFYRDLGRDLFQKFEIYPQSMSLDDAIQAADVVTTLYSTAGLEAMILDCPLLVPCLSDRVAELAWWPRFGGGVYVKTPSEFAKLLNDFAAGRPGRRPQLARQRAFLAECFIHPGCAAGAIIDILGARTGASVRSPKVNTTELTTFN
jgi:hypothetical protein